MDESHLKYFGKLKSLKTLELADNFEKYPVGNKWMQIILNKIHAADLSLKDLHMLGRNRKKLQNVHQLIDLV